MHLTKSNHFYLHHALGTDICPLHGPATESRRPENQVKSNENSALEHISPNRDDLVQWLRTVGAGVRWMLKPDQRDHPLLRQLRQHQAQRLRFGRRLAQSPLLPESSWLLAGQLKDRLGDVARWAVLDDDHHLTWALQEQGFQAEALIMETGPEDAGLEGLEGVPYPIHWSQDWLAGFHGQPFFEGVILDTLHVDNMLHFSLLRALELLQPGGTCVVLSHPWQRALIEQLAELTDLKFQFTHHEMLMRYGAHFAPHENLWDVTCFTVEKTNAVLTPQKKYTRKAAKEFEPSVHLVGAGTLQLTPQAQFTAAKWNEALTLFEKGGKIKVSNKHFDAKHTFWTFPNGGHLVVRHDEDNNWLQADFSPWRPRLFAQFTAAVLTYFPRAFPYLELP